MSSSALSFTASAQAASNPPVPTRRPFELELTLTIIFLLSVIYLIIKFRRVLHHPH